MALREHYKQKLNENPLPHTNGLEAKQRQDVQQALETATKHCKNRYAKGKRSFELFEKLDPAVLKQAQNAAVLPGRPAPPAIPAGAICPELFLVPRTAPVGAQRPNTPNPPRRITAP